MSDALFEVRNPEIEESLRKIGRRIKGTIPDGWGFTLMMFNFGKPSAAGEGMFYISSATRDDMVRAMQEFIDREKARPTDEAPQT